MSTQNRIPFTQPNLIDFVSIVTGEGSESDKKEAIIAKLDREYASVFDIQQTLKDVDITEDPDAASFLNLLSVITTTGGANMPAGSQIYLNPFRNSTDPKLIGSNFDLANDIYNRLLQNSAPTTQQTVSPQQKRSEEVKGFLQ
jgi:hypothetical protein